MTIWQKFLKKPAVFRSALNLYPPYVGAGIVVDSVSNDFRCITILLKDRVFNRNYVGSHFGGSLFSKTDPFYMLMLIQILGSQYYVWDIHAEISFLAPAYGTVRADFVVTDEHLSRIRQATAAGEKHDEIFDVDIKDSKGEVVSRVKKTVYIRLKPQYRPEAP